MRKTLPLILFVLLPLPSIAASLDRMEASPSGWNGPVFNPSYQFPATPPPPETRPWESIDFRHDVSGYMAAVLKYVFEGQDVATWDVSANPVRKWYHEPWMGPGGNGREFTHGLTRERNSRSGELSPKQSTCRQNWAVGFYNPVGGYTLGQIWKPVADNSGKPDLKALPFSSGTVVAKLLYTEASASEVPLLAGAPELQANITVRSNPASTDCPAPSDPRQPGSLRLLQLDIAVRDDRALDTGWVFGTFVFDGRLPGADPWAKLSPVGLMWGNDYALTDADAQIGKKPDESIVLSDFGFGRQFGRGGRMNGPVDNRISACISCHMTAQWPNPAPVTPAAQATWEIAKCWFRNLNSSTPFGLAPSATVSCGTQPAQALTSLDFSLQLAVGLRNYALQPAPALTTFSEHELKATRRSDNTILEIDGVDSFPINREGAE